MLGKKSSKDLELYNAIAKLENFKRSSPVIFFCIFFSFFERPPEDQACQKESTLSFFFPKNIIEPHNNQKRDRHPQSKSSTSSLLAEIKLKNSVESYSMTKR